MLAIADEIAGPNLLIIFFKRKKIEIYFFKRLNFFSSKNVIFFQNSILKISRARPGKRGHIVYSKKYIFP